MTEFGVLSTGTRQVLRRMLLDPVPPNTILSPVGVWLLLVATASGAVEQARADLAGVVEDTTGAVLDDAMSALAERDVHTGLGAWTAAGRAVPAEFAQELRRLDSGPLPQLADLDRWADRHTDGLIRAFPLTPDRTTALLLASAAATSGRWTHRRCRSGRPPGPQWLRRPRWC